MNSLERVVAAVGFQKTDRVPVIAQVFAHAATLEGVPVDEYVQDGEILARCQLKALAHYGYDAVFSVMDVSVEAEAVGSVLQYRRNQYPFVERHPFRLWTRGRLQRPPIPKRRGACAEMLERRLVSPGKSVATRSGGPTIQCDHQDLVTKQLLGIRDGARGMAGMRPAFSGSGVSGAVHVSRVENAWRSTKGY